MVWPIRISVGDEPDCATAGSKLANDGVTKAIATHAETVFTEATRRLQFAVTGGTAWLVEGIIPSD
jgi:hypothetical protein